MGTQRFKVDNIQESHKPGHESIARPLENFEKGGQEGSTDDESDCPAFEEVSNKQAQRCLVEAMFLLKDKGLVY